ncbi:DUF3459 domain-containing protein [Sphingomonas gilva]|uniref:DUF3459 domain-containing protein n=1 Tax=Sphingomonas gilva TaxID=2305907 RepID=A0A396RXU5_9SPHN|nr:alpha-amylase family glycosyl hydrolase [Sphingomonas gilva]RHW19293.1 DUF3459 domain-containing protein [Sphingomonas gilva]
MKTMRMLLLGACLAALTPAAHAAPAVQAQRAQTGSEVFYHIFMRSFRDSDGDRDGDLRGLTEKLDYLVSLGVTSILLTPLQPSPFYHNYFATDFRAIDPDFGTMEEYFAFVRAAHKRGLKVYLDQEIQYVAEGHPWLTEARGNPRHPQSEFVLWNRPGNQEPEPFLKLPAWPSYDGSYIGIAMIDMRKPAVKRYFRDLLLFWLDPHGDGSLRDGVDGFRIDHMMDDLDHKGRLTNLFADFWAPIFAAVRARNPKVRLLAEQADWGYGEDWLKRGDADLAFAFPLRGAITKFDKREIIAALRETRARTPAGKGQIIFVENHDTDRFATLAESDPARLRVGAALNILLSGEPLIYYGQELGMRGRTRTGGLSDAAHIPLREAFRWRRDLEAEGSAIWYKSGRPGWTQRYNRSGDGVSLEAQEDDPASLFNWYRTLLKLRAERPEIRTGEQQILCDDAGPLLCILRQEGDSRTLIVANLGEAPAEVASGLKGAVQAPLYDLITPSDRPADMTAILQPMEVRILGSK